MVSTIISTVYCRVSSKRRAAPGLQGSKRLLNNTMNNITANTQGIPTQAGSKIANSFSNASCFNMPLTTRLVLVPIKVHMPPIMAANDKGIISCEAGKFIRRDQSVTTGTIIATTGVLFSRELKKATGNISRICASRRERGRPSRPEESHSTAPAAVSA